MTDRILCVTCGRPVTAQLSEYEDICDLCVTKRLKREESLKDRMGNCEICDRYAVLVVDHDHTCHKYSPCHKCRRGSLCISCNTGIGKLGDNAEGLRRALAYLERYEARGV